MTLFAAKVIQLGVQFLQPSRQVLEGDQVFPGGILSHGTLGDLDFEILEGFNAIPGQDVQSFSK